MSLLSGKKFEEFTQMITANLSAEICEAGKVYAVEAEVERIGGEIGMMRTVKEGKERYRDTLREFVECLQKRIQTAELLCEQEKAVARKAEAEQRATSSYCALALGKAVKIREDEEAGRRGGRGVDGFRQVREELKRKLEESRGISSELSVQLRTPKCRFCPN